MYDIMRPGLYGEDHLIVPAKYAEPDISNIDIYGAVYETIDSFLRPTKSDLNGTTISL
jgi:hypothetical protein